MVRLKQIEEFLGSEPIAMAGVSRNPKKFGYAAFKELKDKGLNIIPVNPFADEIYGTKVYPDIKTLPADVKGLIIMTKKDQTPGIIREAKEKGIRQIWVQQMADSKDAIRELENSDINYITKECILMYYKPNSIHKFHRALKKIFGRYPK
ncbi:MAG: CoA-binding protein [Bacteroidales bacterium]|nr:CoA-binding protein [Bacteroidales bacterium]